MCAKCLQRSAKCNTDKQIGVSRRECRVPTTVFLGVSWTFACGGPEGVASSRRKRFLGRPDYRPPTMADKKRSYCCEGPLGNSRALTSASVPNLNPLSVQNLSTV